MKQQKIGLEYEIEGLPDVHEQVYYEEEKDLGLKNWRAETDGTLRDHGVEFVSHPISIDDGEEVLKELLDFLGGSYNLSHRCSQHIHVGIAGLKKWQKVAFYMGLVAEEDFFFQFNPNRIRNHYCTPLLRSPAFYNGLMGVSQAPDWAFDGRIDWSDSSTLSLPPPPCGKYSSVNVLPSLSGGLGTYELRHFSPIMDTKKLRKVLDKIKGLSQWAHECPYESCDTMTEYAQNTKKFFESPDDLQWCVDAVDQLKSNSIEE